MIPRPRRRVPIRCAILAACWVAAATAADEAALVAGVGFSPDPDPRRAATAATHQAVAALRARGGGIPRAILFHERTGTTTVEDGATIGAAVKAAAGGAPTWGDGGAIGTWGVAFGAAGDRGPGFTVLALDGIDLEVRPFVEPGVIAGSDPAAAARRLADRLPEAADGLVLVLAGVAYEQWTTWTSALHRARPDLVWIHGMGRGGDYCYLDGVPLDLARPTLAQGQVALQLRGRFRVALSGTTSRNQHDHAALRAEADLAARDLRARLGGVPDLIIAYSDMTRLRWSRLMDPGAEPQWIASALGVEAPLFGGYCVTATGRDLDGRFTTGEYRLVLAGLRGLP